MADETKYDPKPDPAKKERKKAPLSLTAKLLVVAVSWCAAAPVLVVGVAGLYRLACWLLPAGPGADVGAGMLTALVAVFFGGAALMAGAGASMEYLENLNPGRR